MQLPVRCSCHPPTLSSSFLLTEKTVKHKGSIIADKYLAKIIVQSCYDLSIQPFKLIHQIQWCKTNGRRFFWFVLQVAGVQWPRIPGNVGCAGDRSLSFSRDLGVYSTFCWISETTQNGACATVNVLSLTVIFMFFFLRVVETVWHRRWRDGCCYLV